jgi:DNA-binding PadR family transcriptional regulator
MADIVRDVFLAFVRVHLLHHAAEKPIYGMEMMEELGRHGYRLSPSTLYPIFSGLVEAGFLRSEPVVVEGKVRKYYRITPSGRKALAEFLQSQRGQQGRSGRAYCPRPLAHGGVPSFCASWRVVQLLGDILKEER